jgi:hypothetical protein
MRHAEKRACLDKVVAKSKPNKSHDMSDEGRTDDDAGMVLHVDIAAPALTAFWCRVAGLRDDPQR